MTMRFLCSCGKRIRTSEEAIGRHGRCPRCRARLTVPAPEAHVLAALGPAGDLADMGLPVSPLMEASGELLWSEDSPIEMGEPIRVTPDMPPASTVRWATADSAARTPAPPEAAQPGLWKRLFFFWRKEPAAPIPTCPGCGLPEEPSENDARCCQCTPEQENYREALAKLGPVDRQIVMAFLGGKTGPQVGRQGA